MDKQPDEIEENGTPETLPAEQPAAPKEAPQITTVSSPATLILQWLTYAFWGWFALAMLWLIAVTFGFYVGGSQTGEWGSAVAYPLAAVIALFLVAGTVDFFYAHREPVHKSGIAVVLMVIHAVIFALCGIGAVIVALFAFINMLINGSLAESGNDRVETVLYTSLVIIVIYLILLARTVLVGKVKRVVAIAWTLLALFAALAVGGGIAGPTINALTTKQDRLLEAALPAVVDGIRQYTSEHDVLPTSLNDLDNSLSPYSSAQAKEAIKQGLIRYTPNTKTAITQDGIVFPQDDNTKRISFQNTIGSTSKMARTFYYRLCVTFKAEGKTNSYYDYPSSSRGVTYDREYIQNPSRHDSGEQCYDLSVATNGAIGL